jgi:hypothetical protein
MVKFGTKYKDALGGDTPGRFLSPAWGEWAHDFPIGWTSSEPLKLLPPRLGTPGLHKPLAAASLREP